MLLKLTEDDFRAMREARRASQAMSHEEYFRFLAQFHYSYEELAARKGAGGERFRLV